MRWAFYLVGLPASMALLSFYLSNTLTLIEYVKDVISVGVEYANYEVEQKPVYWPYSNMSSLLFIGAAFGLLLGLWAVLFRIIRGRWPHE
jgi:hypothetical protein